MDFVSIGKGVQLETVTISVKSLGTSDDSEVCVWGNKAL